MGCRVELPRLQPLYERYHDQGLEIVAVEAKRDTERARQLIDDKGLSFTFLENGTGDAEVVRSVFKVFSFPTSFLIDRQGRIMYYHLGFDEGDEVELESEIQELLGS
jgi:peroxiredoxin